MRKRTILMMGTAVFTLLFGFGLLGCEVGDGAEIIDRNAFMLEGQVYDGDFDPYIGPEMTFIGFAGENNSPKLLSVVGLDPVTVSPDGELEYNLKPPANLDENAIDMTALMGMTLTPETANVLVIICFITEDGEALRYVKGNGNNLTHEASFFYADVACTIQGTTPGSDPMTLNCNLEPGWNTIIQTRATNTMANGTANGFQWVIGEYHEDQD